MRSVRADAHAHTSTNLRNSCRIFSQFSSEVLHMLHFPTQYNPTLPNSELQEIQPTININNAGLGTIYRCMPLWGRWGLGSSSWFYPRSFFVVWWRNKLLFYPITYGYRARLCQMEHKNILENSPTNCFMVPRVHICTIQMDVAPGTLGLTNSESGRLLGS